MIAVVDYGMGNLRSVEKAFEYLGFDVHVTDNKQALRDADHIVLPGVGAIADALIHLEKRGLTDELIKQAESGKPFLGICLGMQLLLDRGEEVRPCPGLGVIKGVCARIPTEEKLPHIGWNSLTFPRPSPLFRGLDEGCCVYFVHSFCGHTEDPDQEAAVTDYGGPVLAAVQDAARGVFGCQFHPEKSGETGLAILQNFAALNR